MSTKTCVRISEGGARDAVRAAVLEHHDRTAECSILYPALSTLHPKTLIHEELRIVSPSNSHQARLQVKTEA